MTERILIVEDDPELAKMWTYLLNRYGYTCDTVHNGSLALDTFKRQPAALVMVDYYLPGGRGTDVLTQIHALPGVRRPVSVLLTSNPYFDGQGYGHLVDAFIIKPAPTQQIMSLVQSYLPRVAS